LIKDKGGFSKIEMMISVVLLMGIVAFSVHIFEKQKLIVIRANQDIEIVSIVNEMRNILSSNENCKASFQGQSYKLNDEFEGIVQLIDYSETEVIENFKFVPLSKGGTRYGEGKIGVEKYLLQEKKLNENGVVKASLEVVFNRGVAGRSETKQFPLYLTLNNENKIDNCSVGLIQTSSQYWKKEGDSLSYKGDVSINTTIGEARLNLKSGIKFIKSSAICDLNNDGMIIYSSETNNIELCVDGNWKSLLSKKRIDI
tara:strand:+ start:61756 stop:62523 length:768 start_codon:yes stop_codon:yes gene_type:complete